MSFKTLKLNHESLFCVCMQCGAFMGDATWTHSYSTITIYRIILGSSRLQSAIETLGC